MKRGKEKMVRICITLPESLVAKIDIVRARLGLSRTAFIRMCVMDYLRKMEGK